MSAIIEFCNVVKKYTLKKRDILAVNNASFSIDSGSFVAIIGASGSGKSTILQMISGIEQPTSGSIIVDGNDISSLNNAKLASLRRKQIGIVFQNFYLEPNLTLRQNIELPAMFDKTSKTIRNKRTEELTQATDLYNRLAHRPNELSGGQIQRTAILRAIYNHPKIILADEPTSNIDHENATIVLNMLNKLRLNIGTTIIIATHDINVLSYADKVIRINEGYVS
jgi:ABC-type lipoprotein export system ATPase subunit